MSLCDVSVVIPAYNAENFIVEALESIGRQTLFPKEVIVINDGSLDGTYEVIKDWVLKNPTEFPVHLLTQQNKGLPATRNVGIKIAVSKWIALLDADDIWEPCHLEVIINATDFRPSAVAAYGAGRLLVNGTVNELLYDDFWDNPSKIFGKEIESSSLLEIDFKIFPRLIKGNFIKPSSLMFLRSVATEIGLFNESLRSAEDREFLVRLIRRGSFVYSAIPITQYRWHDDNATQGKHAKRNIENGLRGLKLIRDNKTLKLNSNEMTACNDEIIRTIVEYFYVCSSDGWSSYRSGFYFIQSLFGFGIGLKAMKFKHVLRSFLPVSAVK